MSIRDTYAGIVKIIRELFKTGKGASKYGQKLIDSGLLDDPFLINDMDKSFILFLPKSEMYLVVDLDISGENILFYLVDKNWKEKITLKILTDLELKLILNDLKEVIGSNE